MAEVLNELAEKIGIMKKFSDGGLNAKEYFVPDDVIRFLATQLGFPAENNEDAKKSLERISTFTWENLALPFYIIKPENLSFSVFLTKEEIEKKLTLILKEKESGKKVDVAFDVEQTLETNKINEQFKVKHLIRIKSELALGYYLADIKVGTKSHKTTLAVAPQKCFEPKAMENSKIWGYALQLYSVKSERNWGVGDFTDLANFVDVCARCGADIIGLNPINALAHDFPEEASPYASISRLFINPIYIDVENVPEILKDDLKGTKEKLQNLRQSETILYSEVYTLKMDILEKLYHRFVSSTDKSRQNEYANFCKEKGVELEKLAIFQTLYEENCKTKWGGWKAWEEKYKSPYNPEIKDYVEQNANRIGFFKFLQFEADRQFKLAYQRVLKNNLKVGFYRDLAVGVGQDSAELWSEPDLFISQSGAGAPPDAFFPTGQKWGLGAFNPFKLKEAAYEPFIKILRANMSMAGALRIDHVMSLMRLYIIPEQSEIGTYVMYNFEDMLSIVVLESQLNQCLVVGESIGNVPNGFLEKLAETNIKSLSVLWAERRDSGWGDFVTPQEYPVQSCVSVETHDMAPLRMWWFGYDIELSYSLGLIPTIEERTGAYQKRETDRWKLLCALDGQNVWPEDNLRHGNYLYGEGYPEGIEEAVHRFVARANSKIFLAQLEDILHVEKLQNLPGTDRDRHPNWRRKLPVSLEKLESDIAYIRNIRAIRNER
ncbi:MAG: 4-alpha-glucanotransferase [Alphaproteobacteria bacterium]